VYKEPHERIRAAAWVDTSIPIIKANTLIPVSLAKWWHPKENPNIEDRCYLQLSGWY
jgi:hypothetical protein